MHLCASCSESYSTHIAFASMRADASPATSAVWRFLAHVLLSRLYSYRRSRKARTVSM